MKEFTIRPATPQDAESINKVNQISWVETYTNEKLGLTKEYLQEFKEVTPERIAKTAHRIQQDPDAYFVAEADGKVVGFCSPYTEEDGRNRLGGMYILPEHTGKGIGSALIQKVFDFHYGKGDIFLEVATYNDQAISFYKKHGFKFVNETDVHPHQLTDGKSIPILTMVKNT